MKPLEEAQAQVLAAMSRLPVEVVPLDEALGLVLAEDVVAAHPVPPFANSAVDGFAVRSEDVAPAPALLEVIEDVPAGSTPARAVTQGTAIRIMTGAPVPDGADAIVMVEDTSLTGSTVEIRAPARPGDHVRPAGGDMEAGSTVLVSGDRVGPGHVGVLASLGVTSVPVRRRATVVILSTGDELASADTAHLPPGAIRDSNRPMLRSLLEELGAVVIDGGIVPDDRALLLEAFTAAAERADAVVTTGGVSMGEHDLVKAVLSELGGVDFWQVAMQPAKPFAFGYVGDAPLFGLPGNPVSCFVGFEQFVRPALLARMGARRLFRPRSHAILGHAVTTTPDKTVFLRMTAALEGGRLVARSAGGQVSNVLSAMAAADVFGVVPVGTADLDEGDEIVIEWFTARETRTAEEVLS